MLRPAGWLYGKIIDLRNSLYDRGVFRSHALGARTISIGNITTGGTGKTPLVAHVAEILADSGETACILTRGYGRTNERERVLVSDGERILADTRRAGDEPVELAGKLLGKAIVVADADRVSAAAWAKREFGITAFVLDDGFQHRRAKRDVDIVCIDATAPFGNQRTVPSGNLREPIRNLLRADAIVVTRSDLVDDLSPLLATISGLHPDGQVFMARSKPAGGHLPVTNSSAFAFCGIGNSAAFFESLRRGGYGLKGTRVFPDHHRYSEKEYRSLEKEALALGAGVLITTEKDMVKLNEFPWRRDVSGSAIACHALSVDTEIDDERRFRDLIISS
jgi:tetraacyldisaccharide 4'-kinase